MSTANTTLKSFSELAPETASRTPILITEQEVAFSTAAAGPVQPTTTRWWTQTSHVVLLAIRRMFLTSADARPARRHYPSRLSYLEHSCMAREMHRL
jgi:hypothetical protein